MIGEDPPNVWDELAKLVPREQRRDEIVAFHQDLDIGPTAEGAGRQTVQRAGEVEPYPACSEFANSKLDEEAYLQLSLQDGLLRRLVDRSALGHDRIQAYEGAGVAPASGGGH